MAMQKNKHVALIFLMLSAHHSRTVAIYGTVKQLAGKQIIGESKANGWMEHEIVPTTYHFVDATKTLKVQPKHSSTPNKTIGLVDYELQNGAWQKTREISCP